MTQKLESILQPAGECLRRTVKSSLLTLTNPPIAAVLPEQKMRGVTLNKKSCIQVLNYPRQTIIDSNFMQFERTEVNF